MSTTRRSPRAAALRRLAAAALLVVAGGTAHGATTNLADQPIFTAVSVPGNVAFTLSVEYPTATSIGNGIVNYSSGNTYLGYFDPTLCYVYNRQTSKTAAPSYGSYFSTYSKANADHSCSGASANSLWSGNFLNWASQATIDPFRWALTGGYRSVDTATLTILEKAWSGTQASSTESPAQTTSQATYANITPFTSWSNITTTIYHLGQYMCMTGTGTVSNGTLTASSGGSAASYTNSSSNWSGTLSNATEYSSGSTVSAGSVSCVEVRVQACNASATGGLESFCTQYPAGNYKPTGLIQQNSQNMRFAVFGYLLDSAANGNVGVRDGGVMRARMKYVGPTKPVPSSASVTNAQAEWNSNTGVFVASPDTTDVSNTLAATGCAGGNCTIPNSGVINYINMFGEHARSLGHASAYKGLDNVGELYYTALRYFKELGDVPEYSALYGYNTDLTKSDCVTASADQCVDGFPVIAGSNWYIPDSNEPRNYKFPIQYACQRNFIIGIGDANTHQDENLPGSYAGGAYLSAGNGSGYEPPLETLVSSAGGVACTQPSTTACSDTTVDATVATNWIGNQEGTINGKSVSTTGALGQTALTSYLGCCGGATFYIAGLAYDAHVKDMLPNVFVNSNTGAKTYTQTLTTYWVDVLEYGTFYNQNQYWMAAKYGGFNVPSGYTEFCSPGGGSCSATTAWPTSLWASLGHTVANGSTNYTVPDNYYSGRDSASMVSGLQNAFASIAATSTSSGSTSLAITASKVYTSNNINYSASYNASDWTGDVQANALSFSSNGAPVLGSAYWSAQVQLAAQLGTSGANYATGRNIVTWNDASAAAVAFTCANLSTAELQDLVPAASNCTSTNAAGVSGNLVVNYLRGDQSNEGQNGAALFRVRDWVLGDIVDSQVVAVGPPGAAITEQYNLGYSRFQTTYAGRKTVVYAGANDGMLHAFDGSTTATGGNELWAYVPGALYAGPSSPATPATNGLVSRASKVFTHFNMVDATPLAVDVDFNNIHSAGGSAGTTANWHSLLIGGLGKGGRAYYAIDITDPSTMTSESTVASKVLWEFNQNTINTCPSTVCQGITATIGYTFGQPVVTKTKKYGWVVLLASGYDNSDGVGYIFVVNPQTGALLEAPISTATGTAATPSGLAQLTTFVPNYADGTSDAIYAGDLLGNIWRVDLTTTTGSYGAPLLLAQATDPSGVAQPITTWPLVQISAESAKRYVVFGTGRTLASTDLNNSQVNTIYAIWDGVGTFGGFLGATTLPSGQSYAIGRSQLTSVTSLLTGLPSSILPGQAMGWYIDLAGATSTSSAEQVDVQPAADLGIAVFGINVSGGTVCDPSGFGRVDAFDIEKATTALVDATSGNSVATEVLGYRIIGVSTVNVGGSNLAGMISTSAPIGTSTTTGSGGGVSLCTASGSICNANVNFNPSTTPTSLNWREIKGGN